jgi:high-affinity nickel permease
MFVSYLSIAFILGLRHGVDFDHVAAILDIVQTTANNPTHTGNDRKHLRRFSLWLALLYVIGHAAVVLTLGLAALYFSASLPNWIDPVMQRVVGVTLVALGILVLRSVVLSIQGRQEFRLVSRGKMLMNWARGIVDKIGWRLSRNKSADNQSVAVYGGRTAFGIGMLHGIGAETGTQVLIIAAATKVSSLALGTALLGSFIIGLLAANTLLSLVSAAGLTTSLKLTGLHVGSGFLIALFSLFVGTMLLLGHTESLPSLVP